MPYFISGVTAEAQDLVARTPDEFKKLNDVDILTRHEVLNIDHVNRRARVADLAGGKEWWEPYTRLLVATGASPFVPPIEGTDLEGVFVLRRLDDSILIDRFIKERQPRRAVLIGAGPIGLEMCESFRTLGMDVTLLEAAGQVMPMLEADLADRVHAGLEGQGVKVLTGSAVTGLAGSNGKVERVAASSGEFTADIVLLGIGIRPVTGLAGDAGIELGTRGAIRVDAGMRTSVPGVFAAGDCATTINRLTGTETWIPLGSTSRKQGRLAAETMFGSSSEFPGVQGTWVVKCFDMTIGGTGLRSEEAREAGFDPVDTGMEAESLHRFYPGLASMALNLVADRGSGRLLGARVVGEFGSVAEKRLDILAVAVSAGMSVDDLQYLDLAYAPPYSTAVDVPIIAGNVISGKLFGKGCMCGPEGLG